MEVVANESCTRCFDYYESQCRHLSFASPTGGEGRGREKDIWAIGGGIGDFRGCTLLVLWGESRQGPRFMISQHWEIMGISLH